MLLMLPLQEAADKIGWYWYLLLVLAVLAAIIWWMFQQSKKQSKQQSQEPVKERQKQEASRAPDVPKSERAGADDLTRIEGIGPKVSSVLKDAGITSFASLAEADPADVKSVLNEAGLQMMNPEGWIEQARLAANEDWEGLQKLQDELKGGRRK